MRKKENSKKTGIRAIKNIGLLIAYVLRREQSIYRGCFMSALDVLSPYNVTYEEVEEAFHRMVKANIKSI